MHLLNTIGMSREQLDQLIESALRFKSVDERSQPLAGKSVALVFFNPSLRTRASMQVGIYELGGNAVVLEEQMAREGAVPRMEPRLYERPPAGCVIQGSMTSTPTRR